MTAQSKYNPVTPRIVAELQQIVGSRFVVFGDPEKLEAFSHDEVAEAEYAHMPECVVRPQSAEEIARVVRLANRERTPVTPRGAGSGLSGGAVPLHGGIVVSLDRMNRILEIDRENMMVVVEPGVITNDINDRVREYGLFYAGYPMSLETCFIGGNVAENAGGGKAVKYGVTGRYVVGLELVTPTGDIVQLGGKRVKDVTGYNLIPLMVGSEGTLGVFTRIILKLTPLPKATVDLLCLFRTPEDAIAAVPRIMTEGGIIPTAIEFMDQTSVKASCEYLNESLPYEDAGAMLLITVDGTDTEQVQGEYDAIGEQALSAGAVEVYVADNRTTSERIWKVRRNIAEAFKIVSPHQSLEDVVVPIAAIPRMVAGLDELSRKYDCPIPCYGHAGDGNLHATPVMNPTWTLERWHETLPKILTELYELTAELGGTISGEHGIGHKRKGFMPIVCSDAHLRLMRRLKQALDPNDILNPGKIVDVEDTPPVAAARGGYRPVTSEVAAELKRIVGERYVIFGDAEKLEPYSHDEVPDPRYAHMPECVVRPASAEEIIDIMKLANRERIPVTPRGAGSGLSGGAVPIHGGIVLLIDRMNHILEIDRDNLMIVVEPGVVTNQINELLADDGLCYPGYPMSLETCFIGGNVAENAGGAKAVKYGVTGRYVMGLDVVTPTGELLRLGGKRVKDVTGYDLLQLMVGSEGTLGVFTRIVLKLLPLPRASVDLLCLFPTISEAVATVPKIMTEGGITPAAIEFMDQAAVRAACEYLNESLPWEQAGAMLLVTVDGADRRTVEREYDAIGEQILQAGALEVYVADNYTTSERIWRVRRNLAEAAALISPHQANEDISIPLAEIPRIVECLQEIGRKYDVRVFSYGHAGDGNIHARIVMNPDWTVEKWRETLPDILNDLYTLTAALGGVISGEHGIGHKRKAYMPLVVSPVQIEMMKSIKRAFDPNNILNPGKIFDL